MTHWLVVKVPRDEKDGKHQLESSTIFDHLKVKGNEIPYDWFDGICIENPGELFYLYSSELYGMAVVKTEVAKTGAR